MNYMKRIGLVLILALSFGSIAFSADDAAILLEEAIYIEETLGDFDEAARIYLQIADNAESGRSAAAQALYRLGKYYEGRGRGAEAKTAFERLAKQFPEQKELIFRIHGLTNTPLEIPQFLPAPWEDGEMLTYSRLGSNRTLVAESVSQNGKKAWKFLSIDASGNFMDYDTVLAEDGTFTPVKKWIKSGLDNILSAEYRPDHVLISSGFDHTEAVREDRFTDAVYDSEQIVYLLRSLPLQMGFETTLPIFNTKGQYIIRNDGSVAAYPRVVVTAPIIKPVAVNKPVGEFVSSSTANNGEIPINRSVPKVVAVGKPDTELVIRSSTTNNRISVVGLERVVTPAGTFNAWKVAYGNKGSEIYYWISDDSHRYPVKMALSATNEIFWELASISKYEKNKPVEYSDRNISFSLPSGWFSSSSDLSSAPSPSGEVHEFVSISDPMFETSSNFTIIEYPSRQDAQSLISQTVDDLIEMNSGTSRYKYYLVRPGSMEDITVSGFPGARFIVDRASDQGISDIVSYTSIIATEDKAVRIYFRTKKEDFDRFKPVFDSIIESIKLK